MENFTPDSLKNFIGQSRTSRKEEMDRLLEQRKHSRQQQPPRHETAPQRPVATPQGDTIQHHDAAIRQHLGSLVQEMLQTGQIDDLRRLLVDHRGFINDILQIIDQKMSEK